MKSSKTGVNASTIINVRSGEYCVFMKKKDTQKKKRAKTCIGCIDNNDGYCSKHKD